VKNIVVVGGGTAGWLTALYAKKHFPLDNITVIESSEIGILGAGEGSTPQLIDVLDFLEIPLSTFIQKTKTTIKNGIKFTNWSQNTPYYYHGFGIVDAELNDFKINSTLSPFEFPNTSISKFLNLSKKNKLEDYDILQIASDDNKTLFQHNRSIEDNKMLDFDQLSNFSIHFDARLFAEMLSEIGINRGINKIDGIVTNINSLSEGSISSIDLDNSQSIVTDFIFDCTGFARLFIGKHFNTNWISYSKHLPAKKAIPFFLDIDKNNIPPYTESIAMNYGWMWKIPLQHRYGCGYVYDSDFISDEDAKKEIEGYLGFIPNYPRENPFNFNPGSFEDIRIKNCLAVGLSSNFIEPLEATSIFNSIYVLELFFHDKNNIFNNDEKITKMFNKECLEYSKNIMNFIYLHYITNKTNTQFWLNFTKNNVMPEKLENALYIMNNSILENKHVGNSFPASSYYLVANGNEILNINNIKNICSINNFNIFDNFIQIDSQLKKDRKKFLINHSNFLKYIGGLNE
jgi:tryptophan halogenase